MLSFPVKPLPGPYLRIKINQKIRRWHLFFSNMMALQSCDPDVNLINKKIQNLDTQYLMLGEFHNFLDNSSDQFSVLHLLLGVSKKTLQNFKGFLNSINFIVYRDGMISIINKPTRVTRKSKTAIDHSLTNSFTNSVFRTATFSLEVTYLIIFLSVSWFHLLWNKQITQKIPLYLKEYLTQNQLSCLNRNCMKPIGWHWSLQNPDEVFWFIRHLFS